jgi:nitronate monooxygenase
MPELQDQLPQSGRTGALTGIRRRAPGLRHRAATYYIRAVDPRLQNALNLLLESERAGVVALEELASEVEQKELRRFLEASRDEERRNVSALEALVREHGGAPSDKTGPFAEKIAVLDSLRDRLNLMTRGQEWVARKTEEALALAPETGAIHDYLTAMANRHRAEVEWGRAEVIRLMNAG